MPNRLLGVTAPLAVVIAAITVRPAEAVTFVPLGELPGSTYRSEAAAVSGDGRVVVGTSYSDNGKEAFRWTAETGMVGLGNVPEAPAGRFEFGVTGVSFDGSVIVGNSV